MQAFSWNSKTGQPKTYPTSKSQEKPTAIITVHSAVLQNVDVIRQLHTVSIKKQTFITRISTEILILSSIIAALVWIQFRIRIQFSPIGSIPCATVCIQNSIMRFAIQGQSKNLTSTAPTRKPTNLAPTQTLIPGPADQPNIHSIEFIRNTLFTAWQCTGRSIELRHC